MAIAQAAAVSVGIWTLARPIVEACFSCYFTVLWVLLLPTLIYRFQDGRGQANCWNKVSLFIFNSLKL